VTAEGAVHGVLGDGAYAYLGIPYAAPPVGPLRWRPPSPAACRASTLEATTFGKVCPQVAAMGAIGDEDCLTLNVWAPEAPPAAPQPVLVFLHGGGNHSGSGIKSGAAGGFDYTGEPFVARGVLFVTVNYRIGALGFLALPALDDDSADKTSGNYGLLDQIQALRWIRANIAAFGGDPGAVTVMGSSAGATDIAALLAAPDAAGLFQRAILQSIVEGGVLPARAAYEERTGAAVVAATGCAGEGADLVACLRALPASAIASALPGKIDVFPRIYTPIVDGHLLSASPIDAIAAGDHAHVPVLLGSNADETAQQAGSAGDLSDEAAYRAAIARVVGAARADAVAARYPAGASPRAAFIAATTDGLHLCPARRLVRALAGAQAEPVYRYLYTHAFESDPALKAAGASHIFELPYLFAFRGARYQPTPDERALSDEMLGYWTRFAATGDPGGAVAWPELSGAADRYLRLDTTIAAGAGVRTEACDFWDAL